MLIFMQFLKLENDLIEEFTDGAKLKVFPNPTENTFRLESKEAINSLKISNNMWNWTTATDILASGCEQGQ